LRQNKDGVMEIDLLQVAKVIWKNLLLILLVGAFFGVAVYAYTKLCVAPTYKADIMVNVNNNSSQSGQKDSVSTSEISASKSLVSTYIVILTSRTVLNEVIEKAKLDYTYEKLSKMVSGESVSSTEILRVKVTAYSPEEAALIANTIAEVLPKRLAEIVTGSSAVVVDYAVAPKNPSSPHKGRNAAIGFIIGAMLAAAILVIRDMMDDTVRDETFLTDNFPIPLLASIPDLSEESKNSYYSYYQYNGKKVSGSGSGTGTVKGGQSK